MTQIPKDCPIASQLVSFAKEVKQHFGIYYVTVTELDTLMQYQAHCFTEKEQYLIGEVSSQPPFNLCNSSSYQLEEPRKLTEKIVLLEETWKQNIFKMIVNIKLSFYRRLLSFSLFV